MAKHTTANVSARCRTDDKEPIEISNITQTTDVLEELKQQKSLFKSEKNKLLDELKEIKSQLRKSEMQRESLTKQIEKLEEENIHHEAKFESHSLQLDELNDKIIELKTELKSKDGYIKSLQVKIVNLEEEKKRYKSDQDTLYLSQVAYLFEQAICSYVLPEVFERDQHATIRALLGYSLQVKILNLEEEKNK